MSFYHVLQFCMLLFLGWGLLGDAVTKPGLRAELICCRETIAALLCLFGKLRVAAEA